MPRLPKRLGWLFWEADPAKIDVRLHERAIIPRILEKGRLVDVQWLLKTYGDHRIHEFLRNIGDTSLTDKTLAFWRAYFVAKKELWANPRASRPYSAAPWIS